MTPELRERLTALAARHDAALAAETSAGANPDVLAAAKADQLRIEADIMALRTMLLAEIDQLEADHATAMAGDDRAERKQYQRDLRLARRVIRAGRRGLGVKTED